jgi:hypothetical protein
MLVLPIGAAMAAPITQSVPGGTLAAAHAQYKTDVRS